MNILLYILLLFTMSYTMEKEMSKPAKLWDCHAIVIEVDKDGNEVMTWHILNVVRAPDYKKAKDIYDGIVGRVLVSKPGSYLKSQCYVVNEITESYIIDH